MKENVHWYIRARTSQDVIYVGNGKWRCQKTGEWVYAESVADACIDLDGCCPLVAERRET